MVRMVTSLGHSAHGHQWQSLLLSFHPGGCRTREALRHACQRPGSAGPASILLLLPQMLLPFSKLAVQAGSGSRSCAQHPGAPKLCQIRAGELSSPTSVGTYKGHAPLGEDPALGQLPFAWLQAISLLWSKETCLTPPTPHPPTSRHTSEQAAWTKESVLLSSLSASLGTCLASSPSPLFPVKRFSPGTTHTHIYTHACAGTHTCTLLKPHAYTHIHGDTHIGKHNYS